MSRLISISLFTVAFLISTVSNSLLSQDWQIQAEGLAHDWSAISAVDSNIAVGYGTEYSTGAPSIFRTLDGGKTWQRFPWNDSWIADISITDSQNIWAVTYKKIYHSSDGGSNWELQYNGDSTTSFLNYIEMFDSLNGIAMGDALEGKPILILKTTDGGENWVSQGNSQFIDAFSLDVWRCIDFVSPDVGYGRFTYTGVPLDTVFLQKTTDGGKTWQKTNLCVNDAIVIRFYDENIGLGTHPYNKPVWRTLDGGNTWESFPIDSHDGWPNDIEFFPDDPAKVFAVFGSSLFFSNDTGRTWTEISTPWIHSFRDIVVTDSQHAWIVGDAGIIHTSTGGVPTFVSENEPSHVKNFALFQNYPNPFNSSTSIRFFLKQKDAVSLKIYNLTGEEVAVLLNEKILSPGNHSINFDAGNLASGIYFYCLKCSQGIEVRRMVLLR